MSYRLECDKNKLALSLSLNSFLSHGMRCGVSAFPGAGSTSIPTCKFFLLLAQESFHFRVRFQKAYVLSGNYFFLRGYIYVSPRVFPKDLYICTFKGVRVVYSRHCGRIAPLPPSLEAAYWKTLQSLWIAT